MARGERTCYTCRTSYDYCPNCITGYNKPKWMFCFCCEECKDVYEVISNYNTTNSGTTKEDVKSVLDKHNVKNYDKYHDSIQKSLNKIVNVQKKNTKKNEVVKED